MTSRYIGGSLLPSSEPRILQPLAAPFGELQVKALPDLDTHALFVRDEAGERLLTMHANGYSCHNLAKWMVAGNAERVRQQVDYILRCGGCTIQPERIVEMVGSSNHESPKASHDR